METRVYGIHKNNISHVPEEKINDEVFIMIAEQEGMIWSLEGFEKQFNNGGIFNHYKDTIIRFINIKSPQP